MAEASIPLDFPDGFVPYRQASPFLDRIGPLYERSTEAAFALGLRVLEHHCNRRGFAHGGLLMTLADIALGKTGERQSDRPIALLTTSLVFDFIRAARLADWIEAQCDFHRTGRDLAFGNCYFRVAEGHRARERRLQGRDEAGIARPLDTLEENSWRQHLPPRG